MLNYLKRYFLKRRHNDIIKSIDKVQNNLGKHNNVLEAELLTNRKLPEDVMTITEAYIYSLNDLSEIDYDVLLKNIIMDALFVNILPNLQQQAIKGMQESMSNICEYINDEQLKELEYVNRELNK